MPKKMKDQAPSIPNPPVTEAPQTIEGTLERATEIASRSPAATTAMTTANELREIAEMYVVDSPLTFQLAATELSGIVARRKKLEEARLTITRPMDEAKSAVMQLFRPAVEMITAAEKTLRGKCEAFAEAERERERKEREEAQRKEREERAAAEERRKLAEEAEAAAVARGDIDAAVKAGELVEAAIAETEMLDVAPSAPVVRAPVASGLSFRETWYAEVVDLRALQIFVGDTSAHQALLVPDMAALNGLARSTKGAMQIPGVAFKKKTGSAVR